MKDGTKVWFDCAGLWYEGRILIKFPSVDRYLIRVDKPAFTKGETRNIHRDNIRECRRLNSQG